MKVLITGFDPFGGESINPAWEAVKEIRDTIDGSSIVKMQIPTVVRKSIAKVHDKMAEIHPDIVISVGQAGGRFGVTPERVAINVTDARIPDNEGNQPIDEIIFEDGDTAYFSNLPVKAMVQAMKDAGYPSSLSNSAGTYICNHVMYGILYYIQKEFPGTRGGFIHVPYAASQAVNKPNTPSMAIADITAALETAVSAAIRNQTDVKVIGGEIH